MEVVSEVLEVTAVLPEGAFLVRVVSGLVDGCDSGPPTHFGSVRDALALGYPGRGISPNAVVRRDPVG